jgi:hypothetical protein
MVRSNRDGGMGQMETLHSRGNGMAGPSFNDDGFGKRGEGTAPLSSSAATSPPLPLPSYQSTCLHWIQIISLLRLRTCSW